MPARSRRGARAAASGSSRGAPSPATSSSGGSVRRWISHLPGSPSAIGFRASSLRVVKDKVAAQVEIQAGPYRVVSLLTREAVDALGLEPGMMAIATIKATNVAVELPPASRAREASACEPRGMGGAAPLGARRPRRDARRHAACDRARPIPRRRDLSREGPGRDRNPPPARAPSGRDGLWAPRSLRPPRPVGLRARRARHSRRVHLESLRDRLRGHGLPARLPRMPHRVRSGGSATSRGRTHARRLADRRVPDRDAAAGAAVASWPGRCSPSRAAWASSGRRSCSRATSRARRARFRSRCFRRFSLAAPRACGASPRSASSSRPERSVASELLARRARR